VIEYLYRAVFLPVCSVPLMPFSPSRCVTEVGTCFGEIQRERVVCAKNSKVRPFLLYTLRHTFATRIAPHVDAWTLCKIMGWSSLSVAMRYIHPSEERVLEAIARLGGHKNGHNESLGTTFASSGDSQVVELKERNMVSADGLEPSTHALKGHCSAN
jgi:hypothetical protein